MADKETKSGSRKENEVPTQAGWGAAPGGADNERLEEYLDAEVTNEQPRGRRERASEPSAGEVAMEYAGDDLKPQKLERADDREK